MKKVIFFIFFLLFNQTTYSKEVTESATVKHLGELTKKQSCKKAEIKAKENAIKNALGLKISLDETQNCKEVDGVRECEQNQISVLSLNGEITESTTLLKEDGIINSEGQNIYFCTIQIKANVEEAFREDVNFQFEIKINQKSFRAGEKLKINILSGQEMYLNIFQWFPYEKKDKVVMLFPNFKEKNNKITVNKLNLPAEGLSYIVDFPKNIKNKKSVDEHLIFIATKDKIKWLNKYFSLEDLNKRLIDIGKKNVVSKRQTMYSIFK